MPEVIPALPGTREVLFKVPPTCRPAAAILARSPNILLLEEFVRLQNAYIDVYLSAQQKGTAEAAAAATAAEVAHTVIPSHLFPILQVQRTSQFIMEDGRCKLRVRSPADLVGQLYACCSVPEMINKQKTSTANDLERLPATLAVDSESRLVNRCLAMKSFQRSDASKQFKPEDLRPAVYCRLAVQALLALHIGADIESLPWHCSKHTSPSPTSISPQQFEEGLVPRCLSSEGHGYGFLDVYNFCRDRLRAIWQDLTVQHCSSHRASIESLEISYRFLVFAESLLCGHQSFDLIQNSDLTATCLDKLMTGYSEARAASQLTMNLTEEQKILWELVAYNSPYEAEFWAYRILASIGVSVGNPNALLDIYRKIPKQLLSHTQVRFALEVHSAFRSNNVVRYFHLQSKAELLPAVLMQRHANLVRLRYLSVFSSGGRLHQRVPLPMFCRLLAIDTETRCRDFCKTYGIDIEGNCAILRNLSVQPSDLHPKRVPRFTPYIPNCIAEKVHSKRRQELLDPTFFQLTVDKTNETNFMPVIETPPAIEEDTPLFYRPNLNGAPSATPISPARALPTAATAAGGVPPTNKAVGIVTAVQTPGRGAPTAPRAAPAAAVIITAAPTPPPNQPTAKVSQSSNVTSLNSSSSEEEEPAVPKKGIIEDSIHKGPDAVVRIGKRKHSESSGALELSETPLESTTGKRRLWSRPLTVVFRGTPVSALTQLEQCLFMQTRGVKFASTVAFTRAKGRHQFRSVVDLLLQSLSEVKWNLIVASADSMTPKNAGPRIYDGVSRPLFGPSDTMSPRLVTTPGDSNPFSSYHNEFPAKFDMSTPEFICPQRKTDSELFFNGGGEHLSTTSDASDDVLNNMMTPTRSAISRITTAGVPDLSSSLRHPENYLERSVARLASSMMRRRSSPIAKPMVPVQVPFIDQDDTLYARKSLELFIRTLGGPVPLTETARTVYATASNSYYNKGSRSESLLPLSFVMEQITRQHTTEENESGTTAAAPPPMPHCHVTTRIVLPCIPSLDNLPCLPVPPTTTKLPMFPPSLVFWFLSGPLSYIRDTVSPPVSSPGALPYNRFVPRGSTWEREADSLFKFLQNHTSQQSTVVLLFLIDSTVTSIAGLQNKRRVAELEAIVHHSMREAWKNKGSPPWDWRELVHIASAKRAKTRRPAIGSFCVGVEEPAAQDRVSLVLAATRLHETFYSVGEWTQHLVLKATLAWLPSCNNGEKVKKGWESEKPSEAPISLEIPWLDFSFIPNALDNPMASRGQLPPFITLSWKVRDLPSMALAVVSLWKSAINELPHNRVPRADELVRLLPQGILSVLMSPFWLPFFYQDGGTEKGEQCIAVERSFRTLQRLADILATLCNSGNLDHLAKLNFSNAAELIGCARDTARTLLKKALSLLQLPLTFPIVVPEALWVACEPLQRSNGGNFPMAAIRSWNGLLATNATPNLTNSNINIVNSNIKDNDMMVSSSVEDNSSSERFAKLKKKLTKALYDARRQ